jgi:hypothetical protein
LVDVRLRFEGDVSMVEVEGDNFRRVATSVLLHGVKGCRLVCTRTAPPVPQLVGAVVGWVCVVGSDARVAEEDSSWCTILNISESEE